MYAQADPDIHVNLKTKKVKTKLNQGIYNYPWIEATMQVNNLVTFTKVKV